MFWFKESYTEAEAKAVKAQETSELSSNDDDKNTRKFRKDLFTSPLITKKKVEAATLPEIPIFETTSYENNDGMYV